MRAVWYDRQGAADEVLVCGELPTPEAGHGEVRVRLEASGVNPSDTYRRRGPPAMEGARADRWPRRRLRCRDRRTGDDCEVAEGLGSGRTCQPDRRKLVAVGDDARPFI